MAALLPRSILLFNIYFLPVHFYFSFFSSFFPLARFPLFFIDVYRNGSETSGLDGMRGTTAHQFPFGDLAVGRKVRM